MATYASKLRQLYPYKAPSTTIDHLVIGGGVVGLSVAAGLVNTCGNDKTTFLVERRAQATWTGDNSEEFGGYTFCMFPKPGASYPVGSLKSKLCVRSRQLLYDRCEALDIPFRKTQKLIVATSNNQIPYLDKLSTHAQHPSFRLDPYAEELGANENDSIIPVYFLSANEALEMEPDLSHDVKGALLVTETGIIDSQSLVDSLAQEIEDPDYLPSKKAESSAVGRYRAEKRGEGVLVMGTRVVRIDKDDKDGWVVQMETGWGDGEKGEVESVRCQVVVNAAGLGVASLLEDVIPVQDQVRMHLVKGNYMSYKGPGVGNVSRLIYPCPGAGLDHLGTHLTLDLDGNVRFGPDIEPIGSPEEYIADPEYWQSHLSPSDSRLESIGNFVQSYLPGIDPSGLSPDYSGIRPNISPPGSSFTDFMIRHDVDRGRKGLVELLGFNSPGLTSSLATGEYVAAMVRRQVWGKVGPSEVESLAQGWE